MLDPKKKRGSRFPSLPMKRERDLSWGLRVVNENYIGVGFGMNDCDFRVFG